MKTPPRFLSVAAIAAALFLGGSATVSAEAATASTGTVCNSALPSQAHDTEDLIAQGGPYPYSQDGTVFSNREGVLPAKSSGYYHEFTVETPGSSTRGARRIVTGGAEADRVDDYYTSDHYATFDLIDYGC